MKKDRAKPIRTERVPRPSPARRGSVTYAAWLRGINLAGKNKLPMRDLAAVFAEAGCTSVRTYIQSGNVVFAASAATARKLPEQITQRIADRFGLRVPVILRTAEELHQVAVANPFLRSAADPKALHVAFLADQPDARAVAALDPQRSPGDVFAVRGREIYLHLPNGMARTKLTNAYFDSTLNTISTMRNWKTVLVLAGMTGE